MPTLTPNKVFKIPYNINELSLPYCSKEDAISALINNGKVFGCIIEPSVCAYFDNLEWTGNFGSGPDCTIGGKLGQIKTDKTGKKCYVGKSANWDKSHLTYAEKHEIDIKYINQFSYFIIINKKHIREGYVLVYMMSVKHLLENYEITKGEIETTYIWEGTILHSKIHNTSTTLNIGSQQVSTNNRTKCRDRKLPNSNNSQQYLGIRHRTQTSTSYRERLLKDRKALSHIIPRYR